MLSKSQIKFVNSLKLKKYRTELNLFVAEGTKIVPEIINSTFKVNQIYCTQAFLDENKLPENIEIFIVNENELNRISSLSTPNELLAICEIPSYRLNLESLKDKLSIVLDEIKDPGNMGTIIRIADWFGVENIICSKESADIYNSKVVQATMGSIARVKVFYEDLNEILNKTNALKMPSYGAFLEGNNIYKEKLSSSGLIIIGNESKGISLEVGEKILNKISIPSFAELKANGRGAESLNAAVAASIICSEFRRRV